MISRFIFREMRNNSWFFFFFILNFAIGLTGYVAIDSFKNGIQTSLRQNSKNYLSADIALSARRKLSEAEVQTALRYFQESKIEKVQQGNLVEFFTMVASKNGSRLVQLKAIDESYPFYGKMILQRNGEVSYGSRKAINLAVQAWVYPELLQQLQIKIGDKIKIGNLDLEISDVILEDSTQTFRLASLAPKIYIGYQNIEQTGLLQMGSTLTEAKLFKLSTESNLNEIKKSLLSLYDDPAIQVSSPEDAEEDSGRVVNYLNDYLGLVSLVGLFLAFIGGTYLFRSFLASKVKAVAVYNILGLDFRKSYLIFLVQLLIAGLVASIISLFFAAAVIPLIQKFIGQLAAVQMTAQIHPKSIFVAIAVSIFGTLFSGLPYLMSLQRIQPALLLQEAGRLTLPFKLFDLLYFLPLMVFFYLLCLLQANSFKVGSIFFAALLVSFAGLYIFVIVLLKVFSRFKFQNIFALRQAVLYVTRKRSSSVPAILALSVAALLLNLIPQIKAGLLEEFNVKKGTQIPSLFLFDIQDEQIEPLKSVVATENQTLNHLSPLVRARILAINGIPFEKSIAKNQVFKTREEEAEARFRNRGFNLSYRNQLSSSEVLVEGNFRSQKFDPAAQKYPEISVEVRFAERLGFKLGDHLLFDVQGVELEGVIASFRSVKWNSFQPNFFVIFQDGVLQDAPKSWLAAIGKIDQASKNRMQNKVVEQFPNISVLDVERTTARILELIAKVSMALQFMSFLSLLAGLFVIYSISQEQTQIRRWDLNMNKILGVNNREVFQQNIFEGLLLGLSAALAGVMLSIFVAYVLALSVFEGIFIPEYFWPLVSIVLIVTLTLLVSLWTGRKVINENPAIILREGGS